MVTQEIRLERTGEPDLVFAGQELASATSRATPDQPRWTELVAYLSSGEKPKWVLAVIGKSALPGESTRRTALIASTPEDFVPLLYKPMPDGGYKLSYPAKVLLKQLRNMFPDVAVFDPTERLS